MGVMRQARAQAVALAADAVRVPAILSARKAREARLPDDGATSGRAVIASSVFIVLLSIGLLFGGRAAIDPLLRPSPDIGDARGTSDIVVTMPDGKFCRHMSFDNTTASMNEGRIVPCTIDITRDNRSVVAAPPRGFGWGGR